MKINPNLIKPSQDFLKPSTVKFIFECIKNGELEELPPAPVVREDETGQLIAIDGHNLIAVKSYLNEEIEVHLAKSADDGLPETSEANKSRNNDLKNKFDAVISDQHNVQASGINSFSDLIAKNPDMFR